MSNECSAGAENSGGGGGGGYISGGSGGSGIVIVRYDNRVYAPGTNSPGALYTPTTPHAGFPAWAGPDGYVAQVEDDSHYHISCVLTNGTSSWVNASAEITPVSTNYTPETAMSAGILTAVYSNGLVHAGWTNVTYQVQLQKIGATNDFFTSTNRPHKAIYYANSVRPTLGTVTNAYNAYSHQSEHLFSSQSERYSELCDAVFLIDNT